MPPASRASVGSQEHRRCAAGVQSSACSLLTSKRTRERKVQPALKGGEDKEAAASGARMKSVGGSLRRGLAGTSRRALRGLAQSVKKKKKSINWAPRRNFNLLESRSSTDTRQRHLGQRSRAQNRQQIRRNKWGVNDSEDRK